jgi:hypothetical protein
MGRRQGNLCANSEYVAWYITRNLPSSPEVRLCNMTQQIAKSC